MPQNLTEKIATKYSLEKKKAFSGDYIFIQPQHVMTHDNSAAVIQKFEKNTIGKIHNSKQIIFTLDHDIQNQSEKNLTKYKKIEDFAKRHNITFYPAGRGIGHQVMCEEGHIWPETLVVASDSHSNMYGGLGCLGTPVTRTDAAAIWASGMTWWQIPPVAKVELLGKLRPGVTGKDLIVALCGYFDDDQVLNHAIEFVGTGVTSLSIEERLTIANMTTEWGALSGVFAADIKTKNWFKKHFPYIVFPQLKYADQGCSYAIALTIDLNSVMPCVSGPNTVKVMSPVSQLSQQKIKIDKAYLVSCVNSRVEDIACAAEILKGKSIATGVKFYLAAASSEVQQQSKNLGHWQTLLDAGAIPLPSGCGPCIGLGQGILEDGEVGISATNRNFQGRMGSKNAEVYLASPAVVAYSAHKGYIDYPGEWSKSIIANEVTRAQLTTDTQQVLPQFPSIVSATATFCSQNNINTDGIYPGKYTYDETITEETQARVVMENYDEQFQQIAHSGDILIAGFNFGTGSSREQAATALKYKKIRAVIAGSFSATYKRNALNNGLLVLESPTLVNFLQQSRVAKTVRLQHKVSIRFLTAEISYGDQNFAFAPLGLIAQELLLSQSILQWIQKEKKCIQSV